MCSTVASPSRYRLPAERSEVADAGQIGDPDRLALRVLYVSRSETLVMNKGLLL